VTDTNTPSLPSPDPQYKDTVTFNKKNLTIASLAVVVVVLIIIIVIVSLSSGDSNTIIEKSKDKVVSTDPSLKTIPPQTSPVVTNKYDDYLNHVLNNSGQANTWTKSQLIEFGDLVCGALDNGNTVSQVVLVLNNYAETNSDIELFAAVLYASINNICPQYISQLNTYINNA
jgi:hypothetical protein